MYHSKRLPLKHLRAHVQIALVAFQDDLERTRHWRQDELGQRLLRDILAEQQRAGALGAHGGMLLPASLALEMANDVLSASDVARLRAGEAIVLDPQLACLSAERMRRSPPGFGTPGG